MQGYVRAWGTNERDDIGSLFTDDAVYYTAPHREPWRTRDGIVEGWLDRKDEPGDWEFRYEILDVCGGRGYVRGWTHYTTDDPDYSNLWVVSLDDEGRCSEFIEWWMEVDGD